MALQASGPISFSQISNEFGLPSGKNLGAYRISQTVGTLSNLPLDTGIPQSGTIQFSNFYSKRLNVVVDFYNITDNSTRLIVRNRYNQTGGVNVIGGLKSDLPEDGAGKRIIANVNKRIGSEKTGRNYCALRTGAWGTDVNLEIVIGSSGELIGAGGDGGAGGGIYGGSAGGGGTGSSALGLQYPTRVINDGGNIISGKGGGGGGAGAYGQEVNSQRRCRDNYNEPRIGGAGGAGGRGLPAGNGGSANEQWSRLSNKQAGSRTFATAGTAGSVLSSGNGGSGGIIIPQDGYSCNNRDARSGAGGGSGAGGADGRRTRPGVDEIANASSPGGGGTNGYAIIESTAGNLISFTGTSVDGDMVTSTVQ